MASRDKTNEASERLVRTTVDSYKTLTDYVVALQKRSVRFALGIFNDPTEELRRQAESNRVVEQTLAEQSRKQMETSQKLFQETISAYVDLLFAPSSYFRGRVRSVAPEGTEGREENSLPIEDYDQLSVEEVSRRMEGLSSGEIETLKDYEEQHKKRQTLLERLDRVLV
jgi:hypothetical protein